MTQRGDGAAADDGRPQQVELLLYRQGPEAADRLDVEDIGKVCNKEDAEQNEGPRAGNEEQNSKRAEGIKRKNSKRSLPVEVPVVVGVVPVADQNGGNEKAGENEEDIDAAIPETSEPVEASHDWAGPGGDVEAGRAEVMEEDHQGRDAANSIQLWQVAQPGKTAVGPGVCRELPATITQCVLTILSRNAASPNEAVD